MRFVAATVVLVGTVGVVTPAAHAHHSQSGFDFSEVVTITGAVVSFDWANPHVYIVLEQTTAAGEEVEWLVEGPGLGPLRRMGWSSTTLAAGDVVNVTARPSRDAPAKILYLLSLRKDETALFDSQNLLSLFTTAVDATRAAPKSLDGVWTTLLAMDVVGRLAVAPKGAVALTAAGEAALDSYDEATMSPALECIPQPLPFFMFVPDVKRITTRDGVITIAGDYDATERAIHMGTATHDGAAPSLHGHSIGRWDGEMLVIDTAAFSVHRTGNAMGVPSGDRKHLVERLTRNEDGTTLTYEFELTDPEYLSDTVQGRVEWAYRPDLDFAPEPCDPEVARRFVPAEPTLPRDGDL